MVGLLKNKFDAVICGAGIAGIAAAYHLSVKQGMKNLLVVDPRAPMSLTSDKSTEAYRNWWPGPDGSMVAMMNNSIDQLESLDRESGHGFRLNQNGYLFCTANAEKATQWEKAGLQTEKYGAGPLRVHRTSHTYDPEPWTSIGADLILDKGTILAFYPFLPETIVAVLHVRRAGWMSAQQLGMMLLQRAQQAGATFINDEVIGVDVEYGEIRGVKLKSGLQKETPVFINAAGPYLKQVGKMMGVDLPVYCERHQKVSFQDIEAAVPRDAPLIIWSDEQTLNWSDDEKAEISAEEDLNWLLEMFPSGVHGRPDGEGDSQVVLLLWEYDTPVMEPIYPIPLGDLFAEVTLRGMATAIPALRIYNDRMPKPFVDGGYYTRTKENRPLACPTPVKGGFIIGAMSGFGIMSALGLGDLLARHVTGLELPNYAKAFDLNRYNDADYSDLLDHWGTDWQL